MMAKDLKSTLTIALKYHDVKQQIRLDVDQCSYADVIKKKSTGIHIHNYEL